MTIREVNDHIGYVASKIADARLKVLDAELDQVTPLSKQYGNNCILASDEESAVIIPYTELYSIIDASLRRVLDNVTAKSVFRDQLTWRIKEKAKFISLES